MNEDALRQVMARLGIPIVRKSQKGWLQASCPLAPWTHQSGGDRRPSFAVHPNEEGPSAYRCHGCHYKGRISQLVRTMEGFDGVERPGLALECDALDIAGVFGSGFERSPSDSSFYTEPVPIDEEAVAGLYPPAYSVTLAARFLQKRGVSKPTADALGLCFDPDDKRILFPVRSRQGELYGFTGRTYLAESAYPYRDYPKVRDYLGLPKAQLLLGLELWQTGKPAFVTEGLIGYARLVENGCRELCNPVALLGSEMTPGKAELFAALDAPVYLMTDPDAAGESCLWGRIDARTGDHDGYGAVHSLKEKGLPIYVPAFPDGVTDIDQLSYDDVNDIIARCPLYGWG